MAGTVKLALCRCPGCRRVHEDLIDANKVERHKKRPGYRYAQLCDTCLLISKGDAAYRAYLAWKQSILERM